MPFSSLKGEKAFQRLRGGRVGRGKYLVLRWLPLRPTAHNPVRVGIVVSSKVSKKATVRNRIRRRLREILRKMHLPPSEMVVWVQPEAVEASYWDLLRDLGHALKKSGLVQ
ncbi:MAG: ribonuclease P protein component [Meiothermus sp.]|uniref:ribonuclease P protein component n=1 Tax=Meiothermus sp. TaxID=1955249 RepID=UPI0025E0A505|nr:ribonuclease P protein component [Meiothermus sp.]MCS7057791.1 ribonuclease P protein component [Meiothermus sp.]MCS7194634.1 ribonuclease P protein component [Meiothermus sp.]MCX7740823.1 ribonuclease P protein component [Meiothermus sp.]MDW8090957.1 ribonuclease P protein component [Meiothermus sp.]MDW8481851.1 ribonuclease P protein component [Meiothermus sp.]